MSWVPLTRESQASTQGLIEEVVGLSRQTFRASAFLAQGDGAVFTEADPRTRKAILGEVLNLGVWDSLLAKARAQRASVEADASRLTVHIEEAERELERRAERATEVEVLTVAVSIAAGALTEAEDAHRVATENLNASREQAAALEAAKQVLAARERELEALTNRRRQVTLALEGADDLPKLRAESETLAGRRPSIEAELAAAKEAEAARAEHRRLTSERDRLGNEAEKLIDKAHHLRFMADTVQEGEATCDRCHRILDTESAEAARVSYRAEAAEADAQALQLMNEGDTLLAAIELTAEGSARGPNAAKQAELEAALRVAIEAERTLAGLAEREKRVEELRAELESLQGQTPSVEVAHREAKNKVTSLAVRMPSEDLEALVARAYAVLHEARSDAEGAKGRLLVAQAELERLAKVEERAAENRKALAAHQSELDLLHLAERAYGPNGIPALIVENAAIPQIEAEADRILAELGTEYRVELRTQREKKTGGLSDTLDIVILSATGERLYESLSGGERSRVNVALRIALARLLAHRRGAESRVLVLDEVEYLDEPGQERLATVLRGLSGDFDTVILVSHVPGLRDVFDTTIQVVKEDGRSLIVGAGELVEAVA